MPAVLQSSLCVFKSSNRNTHKNSNQVLRLLKTKPDVCYLPINLAFREEREEENEEDQRARKRRKIKRKREVEEKRQKKREKEEGGGRE